MLLLITSGDNWHTSKVEKSSIALLLHWLYWAAFNFSSLRNRASADMISGKQILLTTMESASRNKRSISSLPGSEMYRFVSAEESK